MNISDYRKAVLKPRMKIAVNEWVLKIELDGEWEECRFKTRHDALAAFVALAADYDVNLQRAVLLPAETEADLMHTLAAEKRQRRYIN